MRPICFIDDDSDDLELFATALKESGCERPILPFLDPSKLLDFLRATTLDSEPHLIITDLNMPLLDGKNLLNEIKNSSFAHIPVIVMSTTAREKDKKDLMELGARDFITKPSSYTQLLSLFNELQEQWC